MIVRDLIEDKDYDYIVWRVELPSDLKQKIGEPDLFFGISKSIDGKLIPLDGDTYSENNTVVSFDEWSDKNKGIENGLTVVIK